MPLLFQLSSVTLAHSTPRILSRIIENINCGNYVFLCKIRKSGILAIKNRGIFAFFSSSFEDFPHVTDKACLVSKITGFSALPLHRSIWPSAQRPCQTGGQASVFALCS